MRNNKKIAVLFATHFMNKALEKKIKKLRRDTLKNSDFYLFTGESRVKMDNVDTVRFNRKDITQSKQNSILSNEMDIARINLYSILKKNKIKDYDFYWLVEYDVNYTGNWNDIISMKDTADLLATHIYTYEKNDNWIWWGSFNTPVKTKKIRAFLPIFRISGKILINIQTSLKKEKWSGHLEAVLPTIINKHQGKIREIGGTGSYTSKKRWKKFYNSYPAGWESWMGEFRWIPLVLYWKKNSLMHPVKTFTYKLYGINFGIRKIIKYIELKLFYEKKADSWIRRKQNLLTGGYLRVKSFLKT